MAYRYSRSAPKRKKVEKAEHAPAAPPPDPQPEAQAQPTKETR